MLVRKLFVPFIFLAEVSSLQFIQNSTDNEKLRLAVNVAIEKACVVHDLNVNLISEQENHFMAEILKNLSEHCKIRVVTTFKGLENTEKLRGLNVILIESLRMFQNFNDRLTQYNFDLKDFFIFVTIKSVQKFNLDEIFSDFWARYIFNVNIMMETGGQVSFFTFIPYSDGENCGDASSKLMSFFRNGSFQLPIFPKKFNNLRNCPIKVVTFADSLAVFKRSEINGSFELDGFDIELLKTLSKSLNFRSKIKFLEGSETWGMVLPNGTATGALGELVQRTAEIGIGFYFLKTNRLKVLDSSTSYYTSPLFFVIPQGAPKNAFKKLLQPFQPIVWIFLSIIFLVGIFSIFLINKQNEFVKNFVYGSGVKNPTMNLLVIVLGSSQPKLPSRNFSRFILMIFSMFCLVQRSIYQGSLYIFLQSEGQEKVVQSFAEMVEKGFQFYMFKSYGDVFQDHPKIMKR